MRLSRFRFLPALLFLFRIVIGLIFIINSISKLADLSGFASAAYNFHLLPDFLIPVVTFSLPPIELFLGVLMLIGLKLRLTGFVSSNIFMVLLLLLL